MRFRVKIFSVLLAITVSGSCFASASTYDVSATLSHAGKAFASPSTTVPADSPAIIGVTGKGGLKLELLVTQLTPDTIQVLANIESSLGPMDLILIVNPGQSANVSEGDLGLELVVRLNDG